MDCFFFFCVENDDIIHECDDVYNQMITVRRRI